MRIRAQLRFLMVYSGGLTVVFAATVYLGFLRPAGPADVHAADQVTNFDRIRVHRIDVVEPDGTPRLLISDRAEFPGEFFHGKEAARGSRSDSAGMLFVNDEGTEDGGLIYGGAKTNGKPESFGHLSFDQYDQDQTIDIGTALSDGQKTAGIQLNDMPDAPITAALAEEAETIKRMPHGAERAAKWADFQKRYPAGTPRAVFGRAEDGSVALSLKDDHGRKRLELAVDAKGNPGIVLLDAEGHVRRRVSLDQ